MANIAISELNTTATTLNDDDLILVSKTEDNGSSFTSAKMKGSVLKSQISDCQFSEDKVKDALNSYEFSKNTDIKSMIYTAAQYAVDCTFSFNNGAVEAFKLEPNDTYVDLKHNSYVIISSSNYPTATYGLYSKLRISSNTKEILLYTWNYYQPSICIPVSKEMSLKLKRLNGENTDSYINCVVVPCLSVK